MVIPKRFTKNFKRSPQLIPYGRQWVDSDDIKEVVSVLKSDWLTQGPKVKQLEHKLTELTGAKYAVCVSSATAGLHLACLAAGIKRGDEVITTPITFVASANCVLYCQAKPIFADVSSDTINIDPVEINKKISKVTKAIIPVHFAGHPCQMEEIKEIAKKNNLIIIEDASHALGAAYKNSKIGSGSYSDMTVFSFHPVKQISAGEGGAVLTNNKKYYTRLLILRDHGIIRMNKLKKDHGKKNYQGWIYQMQSLGFNYRLSDIHSALGLSQLRKLSKFIRMRRKIAQEYIRELSFIQEIILPEEKQYAKSAWHIFYLRLVDSKKRSMLYSNLQKLNIGAQIHYIPVYHHPFYRSKFGYKKGLCKNAEDYYQSTVTIPLFPKMTVKQKNYVLKVIKLFFSK